jgi:hypothetical protein
MITIPDLDHLTIARRYAAEPDDWPFAPRFDPVTRWYHRLAALAGREAWLLSWLPGQSTDLHDHGGSAGAFVVVSGELTERTVSGASGDRPRLVEAIQPAGAGRSFGTHHIHQIINNGDRPAVSVHVYGPALRTMTRYELAGDSLRVTSVDRAGVAW